MDIRNLITFVQVAEMNSFTKAADFLGYSQSTVSFQIKQLETEFNCQLFERINHSISLTQKGKELLEYAHRVNKLTAEITQNMTNDHSVRGTVRIATAESLCPSLMGDRFLKFRSEYPDITIKIITAGTEDMFKMMDRNEVDAILTLDSHIYDTEYIVAREERMSAVFVAGPGELSSESRITVRELMEHPFVLTEKGMSYRRIFEEKLAEMSLEVNPVLEMGNARLIAEMVEQGVGISLLPEYVVRERVNAGRLTELKVEGMEIEIWKQLLYHKKKWISKPLECVFDSFFDFG